MEKESLRIFFAFMFVVCSVCGVAVAEDFVPFVIPAKPNIRSPIAFTSIEPILVESDRLRADAGHFYRGGERVRLWGVNFSFGANLPKHEDAPHIAARLAAAGVNAVRCHHLDTSRWPRGLWNAEDGKTITPEALDRLDFFIDQLARHGILVNVNLHVGRAHSEYLGLAKSNRQYDKISNIFTPVLVDAQKRYACELLAHFNPYRKARYADDPVVAIVEITNENSFFMWSSEETLRTLPAYYADILQKKFNIWLEDRYGLDEKLRSVWSAGVQPLGENLLLNGNVEAAASGGKISKGWQLEQHSGSRASLSARRHQGRDTLCITIDQTDQTEWHLQFEQKDLPVKAGRYYTVTFEAAGDRPRTVGCGVSQAHEPWANLGLSRNVELTPEWQTFRFGFVATADDENARVSFAFGGSKVPIYLANAEFRSGGRMGLGKSESIKAGSVALFGDNESPQRAIDHMCFLAETEKAYFDDMRSFVKDALNCKALVTGTIVFGPLGLYAQSDMDFIDAHAYWQHPRFPGRPWDAGNWIVSQKPMTDYPAEATLFRLAAERLRNKPFTVSEYNQPAPLDSQAECVPMLASFAAAQDWDGLWLYTYSHSSDNWDRENLNSYFDIDTNPAKWGFMRSGAV
ncbi:MAG: carbohydrate binding domain-containing protein, partial [Planctomycetota bacterium]